jgi:hypothetical protein
MANVITLPHARVKAALPDSHATIIREEQGLENRGKSASAHATDITLLLENFDAVVLSHDDELIVADMALTKDLQKALGFDIAVLGWRSYRKKGAKDFRLHAYITHGNNGDRLVGLYAETEMRYFEAIEAFRRADSHNVLQLSDGSHALIYSVGLSPHNGYSLECMLPLKREGMFLRIIANSIGFSEGAETDQFDARFRQFAQSCCEAVRQQDAIHENL